MVINLIVIAIALVIIGLLVYMIVRLTAQRDVERTKAENYARQIQEQKDAFALQIQQTREAHDEKIAVLKELNEKQMKSQLELIKEQMQTTSERILKARQEELGAQNK
jgi:DNA recombination protein RmuC